MFVSFFFFFFLFLFFFFFFFFFCFFVCFFCCFFSVLIHGWVRKPLLGPINYMSRNVRKRTSGHVHPAKIKISLSFRAVWSESSLGIFWIAKNAKFLRADNEDFDQTAWTHRLILVHVVRTYQKVRFLSLRLNCALRRFFIGRFRIYVLVNPL